MARRVVGRRFGRAWVTLAVAVVIASALPTPAFAAGIGHLTFKSCIADGGGNGCTNPSPSHSPLSAANALAVSPDGKSVYVTAGSANSLSRFNRSITGVLKFAGCIANGGSNGCVDPSSGNSPLSFPADVAVSPDGKSVYVVSFGSNSISRFNRALNGAITYAGCFANGGANGCTNPSPGNSVLSGAEGVAVSPNGKSVYVASTSASSVSWFNRATNGALTFADCIANGGGNGCTDPHPGFSPLSGAAGVTVSPDGKNVYVASATSTSVSVFTRALDGSLTFTGCMANGGANGCTDPGHAALTGASTPVVSPDGKNVYVASSGSGSVMNFARGTGGAISFKGCVANGGADGCTDPSPTHTPLSGADGLAASPDGKSIYVASFNSHSISTFNRSSTGAITFAGCISSQGLNGCTNASPGNSPLNSAQDVAVSPEGANAYAASPGSDSVSTFRRQIPRPDTKITGSTIQSAKHKATFSFTGIGTVTGFQCELKKGTANASFSTCKSPKTYLNLTRGSYTFFVRAVNTSGPDLTPASKAFSIG